MGGGVGVPQIYQEWELGQRRVLSQEEAWDGVGDSGMDQRYLFHTQFKTEESLINRIKIICYVLVLPKNQLVLILS